VRARRRARRSPRAPRPTSRTDRSAATPRGTRDRRSPRRDGQSRASLRWSRARDAVARCSMARVPRACVEPAPARAPASPMTAWALLRLAAWVPERLAAWAPPLLRAGAPPLPRRLPPARAREDPRSSPRGAPPRACRRGALSSFSHPGPELDAHVVLVVLPVREVHGHLRVVTKHEMRFEQTAFGHQDHEARALPRPISLPTQVVELGIEPEHVLARSDG